VVIDHYEVLGLRRDATQVAIKRAYRRLAKKHHPDRNPGDPEAGERFKMISAAYEALGDADGRRLYDLKLFGLDGAGRAADPTPPTNGVYRDGVWDGVRDYGAFEWVDGALGCLLALSFAIAAAVRSAAPVSTALTLVALTSGWLLTLHPKLGFRYRLWRETALLLITGLGVVANGLITPTGPLALIASSGWFPAVAGGIAGGFVGAGFGRIFRWSVGPAAGALSAMVIGAAIGGGVGGFLWYWTAVFRWTHWPPNEELSLVAVAGVIGGALGSAVAALVGAMRVPHGASEPTSSGDRQ
jgi:hypothetical protein